MLDTVASQALAAAAPKWVKATEARHRLLHEHVAFGWPDSDEVPPPEPQPVTQEAPEEWENRKALARATVCRRPTMTLKPNAEELALTAQEIGAELAAPLR